MVVAAVAKRQARHLLRFRCLLEEEEEEEYKEAEEEEEEEEAVMRLLRPFPPPSASAPAPSTPRPLRRQAQGATTKTPPDRLGASASSCLRASERQQQLWNPARREVFSFPTEA